MTVTNWYVDSERGCWYTRTNVWKNGKVRI